MAKDPYVLTDRFLLAQIGQKIKQLRIAKQFSQQQLSARCGLSVFSISQIENGSNPSVLSLLAILRALDKLDYLNAFWADEPINPIALVDYAKSHPQPQRVSPNRLTQTNDKPIESEW